MNIWIVAPEYAPYAAFGGIATGLRGLAEALRRRTHGVTVTIPVANPAPFYGQPVCELTLDYPWSANGSTSIVVREVVEANGVRVLLFELQGVDSQGSGYGNDVSVDPQSARRCGLFNRAVVEMISRTHDSVPIDVVHAHEWPTAMVPYLLRHQCAPQATVFTIHSLAYQGLFPTAALSCFGLGPEHATMERLELYGRISLLKGGILAANRITTVSPTYAREIQTPERGELLDGVLRTRRDKLVGIINGIDTNVWNPATDSALEARFDARDLTGKRLCKTIFCAARGFDPDKPLVVSLGRLVEQKGIDWLVGAIPEIIKTGANVAIAGAGDAEIERLVLSVARSFPNCVAYLGRVTDEEARRLLAAADLLMMPSRWEPCGIVQLQAMRYGVLPVARRTGGLADTIIDADERPDAANGFLFDETSAEGVACATLRAISRLDTPDALSMQRRAMLAAHGWEGPARSYEAVYRQAIG